MIASGSHSGSGGSANACEVTKIRLMEDGEPMELVQIAPFSALPPTDAGTPNRIHGLLTGRGPDVTVTRFAFDAVRDDYRAPSVEQISEDYVEYTHTNPLYSVTSWALRRGLGAPPVCASRSLASFGPDSLEEVLQRADAALVEFPWQYPYVRKRVPEDTVVIYSSHDYEPELYDHLTDRTWGAKLHDRIVRLEREAVTTADMVVVTAERDRRLYRDAFDEVSKIYVSPNRAFERETPFSAGRNRVGDSKTRVLFVGSKHPPNVEGFGTSSRRLGRARTMGSRS